MTYIRTAQGWLHLAVVLDLYSRAVVGWAMHRCMQQALVHAAGDGRRTPTAASRAMAALGSRQPILHVRLPSLASAASHRAQPFTTGELLGHAAM